MYSPVMGKRQDILDATRDIIMEEGIPGVSFAKIFERANVGSGTAYNYFAGKQTLLNTLYAETQEMLDAEVMRGFDESLPLENRFHRLGRNFLSFVLHHRSELAVLVACGRSPSIDERLRTRITPSIALIVSQIEEGIAVGAFRAMDSTMAYRMISGALIAAAQGHLDGKYALDERAMDLAVDGCRRMIAAM